MVGKRLNVAFPKTIRTKLLKNTLHGDYTKMCVQIMTVKSV